MEVRWSEYLQITCTYLAINCKLNGICSSLWSCKRHDTPRTTDLLQLTIHHQRIDEPELMMLKCPWQFSRHLEPKFLPESDCAFVRRDHEIELHCPIPNTLDGRQGMFTHSLPDARPPHLWIHHKRGICDMRSPPRLMPLQPEQVIAAPWM